MSFDAAAYLGAWPFRPLEGTAARLAEMMQRAQVREALVSPLEGFFYADPAPANDRLLRRIAGRSGLWAAPILNMRMPDWEGELARMARRERVRAVRLAPGFHGYSVGQTRGVLRAAQECEVAVVVQLRMQDERHHHTPAQRLPTTALEDVVALAAAEPGTRVVAAAARLHEVIEQGEHIRQLGNLWLDTSHLDGLDCVRQAIGAVGARRLLFATCWPFFYAESAALKLAEAQLPQRDARALTRGSAQAAFALG